LWHDVCFRSEVFQAERAGATAAAK
jgi:hypothetical protein